jgi:hypothetical protein
VFIYVVFVVIANYAFAYYYLLFLLCLSSVLLLFNYYLGEDIKHQNKIEKNILILLPVDVSRYFLNTWLEVDNIGFLDQAFCNKNLRNFF